MTKRRFIDEVNFFKIKCKCGHVLTFLKNHSATCKYCGRLVYPTPKCEFFEKLERKIRRYENYN